MFDFNRTAERHEFGTGNAYLGAGSVVVSSWERDYDLGRGGDGRLVVLRDFSAHTKTLSRIGHSNAEEVEEDRNSQISSMIDSFSLPSELMSFAFTYEKAYCSSIFMNCWTTERTLSRMTMPIRMRHLRPKGKFECLTWYVVLPDYQLIDARD